MKEEGLLALSDELIRPETLVYIQGMGSAPRASEANEEDKG